MNDSTASVLTGLALPESGWQRFLDSDFVYSFRRTPAAVGSAIVLLLFVLIALFAPWLAPQNPFDPAALDLLSAGRPTHLNPIRRAS